MAIWITTADGNRRQFNPGGGWDEQTAVDAIRHSDERWLTIEDANGTTIYLRLSQVVSIEHEPEAFDPHA